HIMRILARRNRVLWINSIAMRRPTVSRADLGRLASKLRRGFGGCREVEPNLFVLNPLVVPLPGIAAADRLNAAILAGTLGRASRRLSFNHPILWSFLPTVGRLLGRLDEGMVIYHCVDEYAEFSGVPKQELIRMERDLVRRADLVLTSSEQLCEERRPLNPNTHFIRHGVDVKHFVQALDAKTIIPEELLRLPRPIIGFIGLLADWVDLELIREIARARPAWSFALIGRSSTDLAAVRGLANVHLLGQKPFSALPAYCRGIDVGIIPFRINRLTLRANPLKLREYLAAGLPVVSTPMPEVARLASLVRLAEGPAAFINAIESTLEEDARDQTARRRRALTMTAEGWEARVEEISRLIIDRAEAAA
ncbi:MAG TPA: glycosyltransferase, partial [Candidatus Polarisedimenticolia bacterium]|nr:glycosyltransferase [Candidatus Polarisedimenticolia bacterium]